MKIRQGSQAFAIAVLFLAPSAWAEDDEERPKREDPWEYDEAKSKARAKAAEEDAEERVFGAAGHFTLSAERLFGISHSGRETNTSLGKKTSTSNQANLLINQNGNPLSYSIARLAFDYFVIDGLSLGAGLGYSASSDPETRQVLIAPRVGYALMFSESLGLWARAGVTFQDQKLPEAHTSITAATVEAFFVFAPAPNIALSLGPTLEATLGGKYNPAGPEKKSDYKQDELGLQSGLIVAF